MTKDQPYGLPQPDERKSQSGGIVPQVNLFGTEGPPNSIDQFNTSPVTHRLSLLSEEPAGPNVISQREHGRHLLGAIRAELSDDEISNTLMMRLYVGVVRAFFHHLSFDHIKQRVDYSFVTNHGITEVYDIFQPRTFQQMVDTIWAEFVRSGKCTGYSRYDRLLAEEAAMCGAVHWDYLRQLPTEPEYDQERQELSEARAQVTRSSYVHHFKSFRADPDRGTDRDIPTGDELDEDLPILGSHHKEVKEVFSMAEKRLSRGRYQQEYIPKMTKMVFSDWVVRFQTRFCCVDGSSELARLGLSEPEDVFDKDQIVEALTDLKNFFFEADYHLDWINGPDFIDKSESMGVLTRSERNELRGL